MNIKIKHASIYSLIHTVKTVLKSMLYGVTVASVGIMSAQAQSASNYPTKSIRLIVPVAAGGNVDLVARAVAEPLSKALGQQVIVENRPGGDSLIAIRAVIGDNDDHQFLFTPTGNFTPHPFRHEKLGYVRERDLLPIARFSNTVLAIGVSESLGVKSLQEFIALAYTTPAPDPQRLKQFQRQVRRARLLS